MPPTSRFRSLEPPAEIWLAALFLWLPGVSRPAGFRPPSRSLSFLLFFPLPSLPLKAGFSPAYLIWRVSPPLLSSPFTCSQGTSRSLKGGPALAERLAVLAGAPGGRRVPRGPRRGPGARRLLQGARRLLRTSRSLKRAPALAGWPLSPPPL